MNLKNFQSGMHQNCCDDEFEEKKVTVETDEQPPTNAKSEPKADDRNVLIRLFGDKTVSISFNNNNVTVSSIKRKIQDISGYPSKLIQLKFGKNTMYDNDAKMNQFNIKNDDILQAITYNTNGRDDDYVKPPKQCVIFIQ